MDKQSVILFFVQIPAFRPWRSKRHALPGCATPRWTNNLLFCFSFRSRHSDPGALSAMRYRAAPRPDWQSRIIVSFHQSGNTMTFTLDYAKIQRTAYIPGYS